MNQENQKQPIPAVNPNLKPGVLATIADLRAKGAPDWIIDGLVKWHNTPPREQRQRPRETPKAPKRKSWLNDHEVTSAPWIALMERMTIKPHRKIITLAGGADGVGKSLWAEAFADEYYAGKCINALAKDIQTECYADPTRAERFKREGLLVIDHEQDRGQPPSDASQALFSSIIISRYDAGNTTIIITIRPFTSISRQFTPPVWSRMTAEDSHIEDCWRWPAYRTPQRAGEIMG